MLVFNNNNNDNNDTNNIACFTKTNRGKTLPCGSANLPSRDTRRSHVERRERDRQSSICGAPVAALSFVTCFRPEVMPLCFLSRLLSFTFTSRVARRVRHSQYTDLVVSRLQVLSAIAICHRHQTTSMLRNAGRKRCDTSHERRCRINK